MEGRTKVTKEVLCEESRFILANVMAEARYGRQNRYDDIRRVCEGAVSIPFTEYIHFLEAAAYLRHDRGTETLEVTEAGEKIVNGGNLTELTARAVDHFKNARAKRYKPGSTVPPGNATASGTNSSTVERPKPDESVSMSISSGGRARATAGGEISSAAAAAAAAAAASSSEVLDSRYEKLASLGNGGIGTVYRARQVPLNREVALKELREIFALVSDEQRQEICRRFTDVVRAAATLAHPNILPIHDVNLDREFPYVVSELCPNGSVRRLVVDAEQIPVTLAIKYLLQSLHALRAAHKMRVVHRGLKPENLLIDGYGNIKVSDFGFSRLLERDQTVVRQVYVGVNSVAYMAPELFTDPTGAGAQADIYALGIIFYELLTRKLPGRRSPLPSQIDPTLPAGIDDIFDNMTRDSQRERYSNVDDILDDFDRLKGLPEFLDTQTHALVGENPLKAIKFKEGTGTAAQAVADTTPEDADVVSSAEEGDDKKTRRPYSYQQRQRRSTGGAPPTAGR